jgi:enoyl-CoA hydratase/carnithine racemase
MSEAKVLVEHLNDGISKITLNSPPLNLLDDETLDQLHEAFLETEARPETRAVILAGAGDRAFSGGHKLTREETETDERAVEGRENPGGVGRQITEQIEYSAKPVICAARGWVVGGSISFVLASDVRIVSETVKFRYVDVKMGMAPAWGLTLARLVHYIGRNRALDFLLDPNDVDATRAEQLGLVTRVVPDDELESAAHAAALHLAKGAPLTVRCIKECTLTQYTAPFEEARRTLDAWIAKISGSEDAREGTRAWLDKRQPNFVGA